MWHSSLSAVWSRRVASRRTWLKSGIPGRVWSRRRTRQQKQSLILTPDMKVLFFVTERNLIYKKNPEKCAHSHELSRI